MNQLYKTMFKHIKHTKEYQKELIGIPTFWIGVVIFILGIILSLVGANVFIYSLSIIIGLFLMSVAKHRILGRLDERYSNRK